MNSLETTGTGGSPSAFASLGLTAPIVRATADESYSEPTPVQKAVVPHVIAGRDVLACAQTGTGKTAAFVLPILHRLATSDAPQSGIAALVLTPTRELAAQITERVAAYGRYLGIRYAVIYGGVSQYKQEQALRTRPRLLVATPGRLLDLMGQGLVRLDQVAHFVLDEADRMLDMGFVNDVRRIARELPTQRQTLLFSATVPRPIEALAQSLLRDPVRVDVTPTVSAAETIQQSVVFVPRDQKSALLERVLSGDEVERAIVFTRTKHGANKLSQRLERAGIGAPAIHGNKSQSARERALGGFRKGTTRILVATDIAARGIDVDGVTHVINFDLPNVPESYVHRVGRTGRAGARGRAISFVDRDEHGLLRDIERLLRQRIDVVDVKTFGDLPERPAAPPRATGPSPEGDARAETSREPSERRPYGERRPQGGNAPHGERRSNGGQFSRGRWDEPRRDGAHGPAGGFGSRGGGRTHGGNAPNGSTRPQGDFRPQGGQRPNGDFRPSGSNLADQPPRPRFQGASTRRSRRNSHW
ncbi:MAG TPA: DEAD/DEAH box helicase [Polyangiaceae bacterium]